MSNLYLQFTASKLGCQGARVQPTASMPNRGEQILQYVSGTWAFEPALHWSTGVSSQILPGEEGVLCCHHARAGLSCCWPNLVSSSLRTLGPQRISMEKCRCTEATSRGFTLKLETIPQVAGCTVVICFLQKTATHISSAWARQDYEGQIL